MADAFTFTPYLDEEDFTFVCDQTEEESSIGSYADADGTPGDLAVLIDGDDIYYLRIDDPNGEIPSVMRVASVDPMPTNAAEDAEIQLVDDEDEDEPDAGVLVPGEEEEGDQDEEDE
jgi:hypothetical protein